MTETMLRKRATVARPGRGSASSPGSGRRRRSSAAASPWWALLFVGPMALGLGLFYLWPTVRTFLMSFTSAGAFGGGNFVGFDNYIRLFQDPELLGALRNTAVYTLIALCGIPFSIAIAALLNAKGLKGRSFYRTLYFIPVVTMPAAVGLVWRLIYNGDYGVLNAVLAWFGIKGEAWLTNGPTALAAIVIVAIWSSMGYAIVIFLAGLQGIPGSLMEAADLDGAGPIRKFFSITLPMLSPSIFFVSVTTVIGALQAFDLIYMMLGRNNPALPEIRTVVFLFYEAGFVDNYRGYAAAIAMLLLVIILIVTALQFRLQKKWVHYE